MIKKYRFLLSAFTCLTALCLGKVLYLQTIKQSFLLEKADKQRASAVSIEAQRGDIKSSDGSILVTSVPTYVVYSDTRYIDDIPAAAKIVADFFKLDYNDVLSDMNSKYYKELVKEVSKDDIDEFKKVKPKGVSFYKTTTRVYPNGTMLGSILGFIGADNSGLAGLELKENARLAGINGVDNAERDKYGNTISYNRDDIVNPTDGEDITITVNYDIQYQMEKEVKAAVEEHGADKGVAISMNPKTGAILGIAEYPSIDPNHYKDYDNSLYKSSALSMTYEPGSTFKPITVAIAGTLGVVDIENDVFPDGGSYYVGSHRIGNWGNKAFGYQTCREILMNSSNVGTVQVGFKIPPTDFAAYMKKLGFGTKTGIELPGEQNSIMFSDEQLTKDINRATNSFGQGIAVTPLQLMRAWSAVINGGYLVSPHILQSSVDANGNITYSNTEKITNLEQVIDSDTSAKVRKMLQAVVEEGTGKKAQVTGYTVGGKTGTAQVVENGKYAAGKYKVSFMGFAPVEDPEILTLFILDNPTNGKASGGGMCAPTVANIIEYSLNRLGVKPSTDIRLDTDTEEDLTLEYKIEDYTYRPKNYVTNNPPSLSYEFIGDGDIITSQTYESTEDGVKVIFQTDSIVKDDYILMPNLQGMSCNDVLDVFSSCQDKVIINGNKSSAISVQDNPKGSHVNISNNSIVLWTE